MLSSIDPPKELEMFLPFISDFWFWEDLGKGRCWFKWENYLRPYFAIGSIDHRFKFEQLIDEFIATNEIIGVGPDFDFIEIGLYYNWPLLRKLASGDDALSKMSAEVGLINLGVIEIIQDVLNNPDKYGFFPQYIYAVLECPELDEIVRNNKNILLNFIDKWFAHNDILYDEYILKLSKIYLEQEQLVDIIIIHQDAFDRLGVTYIENYMSLINDERLIIRLFDNLETNHMKRLLIQSIDQTSRRLINKELLKTLYYKLPPDYRKELYYNPFRFSEKADNI